MASWKQQEIRDNSLCMVELVDRASSIANDLMDGMSELHDQYMLASPSHCTPFNLHASPSASITSTFIWAHAAQLYLSVVVSGRQLSMKVRTNVSEIIELL